MKKSNVQCPMPNVPRRRQAAGFTLLELLIVIALIMVLAGLLIPAFYKVRNKAKQQKRSFEVTVIESAIRAYKLQERKFPAPDGDLQPPAMDAKDYYYYDENLNMDSRVYGGDNRRVMDKLRGANPPVLDVNKLRWENPDGTGSVLDPDGAQYKITLDLNYDGKIGDEAVEYKVE